MTGDEEGLFTQELVRAIVGNPADAECRTFFVTSRVTAVE